MDVIISEKDGIADRWGDDYFKRRTDPSAPAGQKQPKRHFLLTKASSLDVVVKTITDAIAAAGPTGTLIFNVGHGAAGAGNALDGTVDLAPGSKLKLGGANNTNVFVNVFYDVNLSGPNGFSGMDNDKKFNADTQAGKQRLQNWATYQRICQAFKAGGLYKVVFLTCNVGNSTEFLRKIANDWGTVIEAYKKRVVLDPQQNGRTRMHLEGDAPGFGTNVEAAEENLPLATGSNSFRVGPPIP